MGDVPEVVRLVLRSDGGAYAVTANGSPDELLAALQRFRGADVLLDGGDGGAPAGDDAVIELTMASPSALGHSVVSSPHDMLAVLAYHAHDDGELLAFDARITEEYTAFYAARGIRYSGVYRLQGLGMRSFAEILAYDGVHSIEEADRLGNEDLPPAIVAIEDECRAHQDRSAPRFLLWLLSGRR